MTKQTRQKKTSDSTNPLARLTNWFRQPGWEVDVIILIMLAMLTLAVFANILDGEFVYDDTRQILQNPVVRDREQFWTGFTTDVWAFKSGGTETVSDYWRPFFILWLVFNERLFGLENTTGWHLTNLLLHIATAVLTYLLLRKLKISRPVTTAITLLSLIHPVHVETVSWISGSPDILLALPILGAFLLLLTHQESGSKKQYVAALILFALALLAKEAAIFFPFLAFLFRLLWTSEDKTKIDLNKISEAARFALPFLFVAALYLAARVIILGHITAERPWHQPLAHVLLTIPSIIAFYLRQTIIPYPIGPSYPIRIVTPAGITFENFWLPLISVTLALAFLLWVVRPSKTRQFGLALFFLFLIPAFNVNAFHPEQIVHDRYLYLPLLGLLLIVIPLLNTGIKRITDKISNQSWKSVHPAVITLLVTAALALPLTVQTVNYNTAWKNELALWQWAVETDPSSMLNTYLYGYYQFRSGRLEEAETAMNTVIQNQPLSGPYYTYIQAVEARLERADIAASQGRTEDARQDLELIINHSPAEISPEGRANLIAQQQRAVERLALSYLQVKDYETAVEILDNGRQQHPQLTCTFTTNMAVSLYISGQKEQALIELEKNQSRIEAEYTPLCKMSLFYLGQLYLELGRTTEARTALMDFLTASRPFYDSQTTNLQQQTHEILDQLQNP